MNKILRARVNEVLADGWNARLNKDERDALLEIAFLAMVSDGFLRKEELDTFTDAMRVLFKEDVQADLVRQTVDQLIEEREWEYPEPTLHEVSDLLTSTYAREQAYKLACLMMLSDFDINISEQDFSRKLATILMLTEAQCQRMIEEVEESIEVLSPAA